MSAPVITLISPAAAAVDVVLGTSIAVTFDQAVDPTSINATTFSLIGPGQTTIINLDQLVKAAPPRTLSRAPVPGTFSFPAANQFVFVPNQPLQPGVKYTILISGAGAIVTQSSVRNPAGEEMAQSMQTTFLTGTLTLNEVPPSSPLPWNDPQVQPWMCPVLRPSEIVVRPLMVVGNDLTQVIELIFPADLDPTTFAMADIAVSVDPLVNDPLAPVPSGLQSTLEVQGNKLTITITGWPS
jgi:hypothetical protein